MPNQGLWSAGLEGTADRLNAALVQKDIAANRPAASQVGRLFWDTTNNRLERDNGSGWDVIATLDALTLGSPTLNTQVTGTAVLDEDDMASDSATKIATQQSIKAYADRRRTVIKSADETIISDETLSNDTHLALSVAASKRYNLVLMLRVSSGTDPDFKFAFSAPSGATVNGGYNGTAQTMSYDLDMTVGQPVVSAGNVVVMIWAFVETAGTAGTLTLQWAQNTSWASNTTVREGSFMELSE